MLQSPSSDFGEFYMNLLSKKLLKYAQENHEAKFHRAIQFACFKTHSEKGPFQDHL